MMHLRTSVRSGMSNITSSSDSSTIDRSARALRSIVEESLLEVMYDIPERTEIRKCIITEETIRSGRMPLLLTKSEVERGVDEHNYEEWLAERGESA